MTDNKSSFHSVEKQLGMTLDVRASLLAKNTIFSLIGQGLPLIVAAISMPFIIHGLGLERFGILALAWAVLGYFNIFDLGLSRAATKFVAEALVKSNQKKVSSVVWTSVIVQAALGVLGGFVLASITPLLIDRILNIPPALLHEARSSFYLIAVSLPFVFITGSFRGVLEASQRFDLVNAIKVPFSMANFLLPLLGVFLGWRLPGIIFLLVASRCLATIIHYWLCGRIFPFLKAICPPNTRELHTLVSFGGWITISNLIVPIFIYLDRFLIASTLVISALSYYTAPYEVVTKLLIIPSSLVSVLFPAFSSLYSGGMRDKLNVSVARSIKYLITIMVPATIFFLLFAEEILRIWLGSDFAEQSTIVFRLLSVAILFNSIGYIPFTLIQGVGRPDVVAKYHLIELPLYVSVAFFLINMLGINGAALAWCLRMGWTIPIFFVLCIKKAGVPLKTLSENGTIRSLLAGSSFLLLTGFLLLLSHRFGLATTALLSIILLVGFTALVWYYVFDYVDKELIKKLLRMVSKVKRAKYV